jgi:hypothetical protein
MNEYILLKKDTVLYHCSKLNIETLRGDVLLYTTCGEIYNHNNNIYKIILNKDVKLINLTRRAKLPILELRSLLPKVIFDVNNHTDDVYLKETYRGEIFEWLRKNNINGFMSPLTSGSPSIEFAIDPKYCNFHKTNKSNNYINSITDGKIMIQCNIVFNDLLHMFDLYKEDDPSPFLCPSLNYLYLITNNRLVKNIVV